MVFGLDPTKSQNTERGCATPAWHLKWKNCEPVARWPGFDSVSRVKADPNPQRLVMAAEVCSFGMNSQSSALRLTYGSDKQDCGFSKDSLATTHSSISSAQARTHMAPDHGPAIQAPRSFRLFGATLYSVTTFLSALGLSNINFWNNGPIAVFSREPVGLLETPHWPCRRGSDSSCTATAGLSLSVLPRRFFG